MTITTLNGLITSMSSSYTDFLLDKGSINLGGTAGAIYSSNWRISGQPGPGVLPTVIEVCDNLTVGGISFVNQVSPISTYLAFLTGSNGGAGPVSLEIHDRLMQVGGISSSSSTLQTINLDMSSFLATSNLGQRKGSADYSNVSWWVEWYGNTGSTAVTMNINVILNTGVIELLSIPVTANRPISQLIGLNSYVVTPGAYIKGVVDITITPAMAASVTLGITATRSRSSLSLNTVNKAEISDWQLLGLPEIYNSSCLFVIVASASTTFGPLRMLGKLAHG